ncbi:activating transcription factor of chaperone isoform X1 [Pogonomyrmex barbatus]|uniref:Activating transcription factor of chaperone isoform X1 n=1 Tax=Pogonomyrmex barbatus TaxID=144034 RepID=A0A6I9X0K9_9HYME|nr:activating transcription factor of chaperone isoform X1 [Pogonomyrmex barbatus]
MSSNLDQEMWSWKYEPVSPSGTPPLEVDEDLFLFNDQSVDVSNNAAEIVMYDDQPSRAQVAKKLLEELDEWIKEEPFSDWLEEKVELPIYDQLLENSQTKSPSIIYPIIVKASQQHHHHQQQQQQQHHDNTQTLLQEFETVLGDVEACHQIVPPNSSTLTPPQSPPHKAINVDTQLLVTLQPVQPLFDGNQSIYNIVPTEEPLYANDTPRQWNAEDISLSPLGGDDVANDLAVVDEYVRSHTKDIPSPSSPCSSGGSCTSAEDSADDPDWSFETERRNFKQSVHDSSKHRHKPYSRSSLEDKKVRKKEQNKNAATRYRQKKKQEIREIQGEERELTEQNEKLKNRVKEIEQEIKYLKGFMRDLLKAKGLLK